MSRRRKRMPPFEVELLSLGKGGAGVGLAPDGVRVQVKPAPVGSRVKVVPAGRRKGMWQARRLHMVRPPAEGVTPRCVAFGLCGGCALQELSLSAQRRHKHDKALSDVAAGLEIDVGQLRDRVTVWPVRGADVGYGYRNKVEMSFGSSRFMSEADHADGEPIDGRWLGFHAPGRFDRVADLDRCELISEAANLLVACVRRMVLVEDDQPLWDPRKHTGIWRHLLLREGQSTGEHLVAFYTTSGARPEVIEGVAKALLALELPDEHRVVGVVWYVNDGVADVARGERRGLWGNERLRETLGEVSFELSPHSFFQTSTPGAIVLYDTVADALGERRGTLFDLYCGIGSIGQYLAHRFDRIVGVEEVEQAVVDARVNAVNNGIDGTEYVVAKLESALHVLQRDLCGAALVVDPPRVGLHPKVAKALARATADELVYVACKPGSLGRDALILESGGWRLTDLWTVDLFPQTGHTEMVGRFVRDN